ncbi:DUF6392 family protein [Erwinia tasmaniensis]
MVVNVEALLRSIGKTYQEIFDKGLRACNLNCVSACF